MTMTSTMTETLAVETAGLVKRYGSTTALNGVDLRVPEQAVYVLVGPNGAGKSTLLRSLMNVVRTDGGTIVVSGLDARAQGPEVRARIGYVPETHELSHPWMRVGRLFEHFARYYRTWDDAYATHIARVLSIRLDAKCGAMSKGERRRVQLVLALAHRPALLLLDEPGDGLDHVGRERVLELLSGHISDSPTTVLVSTHRIYEVERLVDHVGVLSSGVLVEQTTRDELQRRVRRYRADVPEGWAPPTGLDVLRRGGLGRSIDWTVVGDERAIAVALTQSGAIVREVASLSLDDAATALLIGRGDA